MLRGTCLILAIVLAGCVADTYELRRDELVRLAAVEPERRGERVRALQELGDGHEEGWEDDGGGGVSMGGGGGGGSVGFVVLVLGTVFIVGGFAYVLTEGLRHDGWVALRSDHTLHLALDDGRLVRLRLSSLTPEIAEQTDEAWISGLEGPVARLERAPLHRVGLAFGAEGGGMMLATDSDRAPHGGLGRVSFGGFPIDQLGILATAVFAGGSGVFNMRLGGELHTYPLVQGRLQLGALVGGGASFTDDGNEWGGYATLGPLLSLELTTRLALTARGAAALVFSSDRTTFALDWALGFALY